MNALDQCRLYAQNLAARTGDLNTQEAQLLLNVIDDEIFNYELRLFSIFVTLLWMNREIAKGLVPVSLIEICKQELIQYIETGEPINENSRDQR